MKRNGSATTTGVPRVTFQSEHLEVTVPDWVLDLESFRRWADSDDFSEKDRVSWLGGEVVIDMSKEQLFSHGQVNLAIGARLFGLSTEEVPGYFWSDGAVVSNEEANLSVKPDGVFVSRTGVDAKIVRFVEGVEEGHVEIEGSPDMVLEVVSRSSVRKDTVLLRARYWTAGIREYWLVDARKEPISFDILRHTEQGYVPARKLKGWLASQVFGKAFRLTRLPQTSRHATFRLEVR
jgi:Uma2 family endonuclease